MFAYVICAARALETAVINDPYPRAVDDITSALNTLRSTVNNQKQQNEMLEGSRSFLKALPYGHSLRDLPIPSMDKIMACLRQGYDVQAATCRESLVTILSSRSFHIDTNIDSICALYMAVRFPLLVAMHSPQSLHCLHRGKVSTAWTFISRASLM